MRTCSIDDCARVHQARGFCAMHYTRLRRRGTPFFAKRTGRPLKGDFPSWDAIHKRLTRQRGPAREYACVDCGGPAREWSYDRTDPEPLTSRVGKCVLTYSLDLDRYVPRCVLCHRKFDDNLPRRSKR